ncbi:hypothetical protein Dimus_029840 [Dionaea muscipula]
MMPTPRRKKWSEAEERTLIDRYGEMVSDGTLAKMKTREKKFRPIALYVNSVHHVRDPVLYPWQWTWKDVSTKVQNMRHQYLLVKQKIKNPELELDPGRDGFEWADGVSHWSNFLRYKQVFGDVPLVFTSNGFMVGALSDLRDQDDEKGGPGPGFDHVGDRIRDIEIPDFGDFRAGTGIDCGENGVLRLGFEYDGEVDAEDNFNDHSSNHLEEEGGDNGSEPPKKKALKGGAVAKKAFGLLASQLGQLREMESRFEHREADRGRERQRREHHLRIEREKKSREGVRKQRILEWESMEEESRERERRRRRRREDMMIQERDWEERMNMRRSEWKKRMDDMLTQHREEMAQLQSRILDEQQNMVNQLLGIFSQIPTGLQDHTGAASSHYLSQMMHNLHHHVNEMVHDDTRVDGGDNQIQEEDQFIVDG